MITFVYDTKMGKLDIAKHQTLAGERGLSPYVYHAVSVGDKLHVLKLPGQPPLHLGEEELGGSFLARHRRSAVNGACRLTDGLTMTGT